ncbi:hypothetical protein ACHAXT_011307 [Thalassiosira profunda]
MSPPRKWKQHSADLLQLYVQRGLVPPGHSLEGWDRGNFTVWRKAGYEKGSSDDKHDKHVYTCMFTCPILGIHFPSGELEKCQSVLEHGTYWYKSGHRAQQAAAAKALDCIPLLDAWRSPSHQVPRRCCDAIEMLLPSGLPLPSMHWDLAMVLTKKRKLSLKHQLEADDANRSAASSEK